LFCSCKEAPRIKPGSRNEQVLSAMSVFIKV